MNTLESASLTLKGRGYPDDLTQDVIGFRALIRQQDPYPRLDTAVGELGLEWEIKHESTHPPTAFLIVAPIAFLPWKLASMIWAWLNLCLFACALRCYGFSWKAAIGLTPIALLWPPVATSLSQFTIIWLFSLAIAWRLDKQLPFWSGVGIGIASLAKLFPGIMVISFLVKKQRSAIIGFISTWVIALLLLILIYSGSLVRYIEVNRDNSMQMILREDNASLLVTSYRIGNWVGVTLIILFFFLIVFTSRDFLHGTKLFTSPRLWMLLLYFSVIFLPVAWIYSVTPLLPIIIYLLSQKKLSTMIIGFLCIEIPFIIPPWGDLSALPLACVFFLIGIGLLFDGLPFKPFNATYIRDLVRQPNRK